jgi:hypothetical protein
VSIEFKSDPKDRWSSPDCRVRFVRTSDSNETIFVARFAVGSFSTTGAGAKAACEMLSQCSACHTIAEEVLKSDTFRTALDELRLAEAARTLAGSR